MVRAPCCEKMGLKKGPWTPEEDQILVTHIQKFGHGNWRALPKQAGLLRCGKSCRLRWTNYLRPDIKRGDFTREEEDTIIQLHEMLGNRWSAIAARLPGRTDNEIKNVWHTHLKKRLNPNKEPTTKTQASDNKAKQQREAKPPQYIDLDAPSMNSERNPASPQESTSNFSFSSTESSSIISCENRTTISSASADESSMDSFETNMFQPCNSTAFWPETLSDVDEFWSETFKEEQYAIDVSEFPAHNVIDPAFNAPLSPLPFSMYQDDSMDFWLNVLMEAGQMQLAPEI